MRSVLKYFIILILWHAYCETCQLYARRVKNHMHFEVWNCSNSKFPLEEMITQIMPKKKFKNYEEIGEQFFKKFKRLELHDNAFQNVKSLITNYFPNLSELKVKQSGLDLTLSEWFRHSKITTLELELETLNSRLINLNDFPTELRNVHIINTKVKFIWKHKYNEKFNKLQLSNLTMSNCGLEEIVLHQCDDTLSYLDLSLNQLKGFSGLRNLNNLKSLNISHNVIRVIGVNDFVNMVNVEVIILSNNLIESIPGNSFEQNKYLWEVILSDNKFKKLDMNFDDIGNISIEGEIVHCDLLKDLADKGQRYTIIISSGVNNLNKLICYVEHHNFAMIFSILAISVILLIVCGIVSIVICHRKKKKNSRVLDHSEVSQNNDDIYAEPEFYEDAADYDEGSDYSFRSEEENDDTLIELPVYAIVNRSNTNSE